MRAKDVRIGMIVDTRVGGERRAVTVHERKQSDESDKPHWFVKDNATGKIYPKARSAPALRFISMGSASNSYGGITPPAPVASAPREGPSKDIDGTIEDGEDEDDDEDDEDDEDEDEDEDEDGTAAGTPSPIYRRHALDNRSDSMNQPMQGYNPNPAPSMPSQQAIKIFEAALTYIKVPPMRTWASSVRNAPYWLAFVQKQIDARTRLAEPQVLAYYIEAIATVGGQP